MNPSNVIRVAFGAGRRVIHTEAQALAAADALYAEAGTCDEDPTSFARAEHLYRQAIALDPRHARAYLNLGNVLFRTDRVTEARVNYHRSIAIDPALAASHYNLGYLRMEENDYVRAIPLFRRAIALEPDFADARFNLAMSLQRSLARPIEERAALTEYLAIESQGEWADIARMRLAELSPRPMKTAASPKRSRKKTRTTKDLP